MPSSPMTAGGQLILFLATMVASMGCAVVRDAPPREATESSGTAPADEGADEQDLPVAGGDEPTAAEGTGPCRAVVRQDDEILLVTAEGEQRLLDRDPRWDALVTDVWALGDFAVVGAAESYYVPGGFPEPTLALVHPEGGVRWRGSAPRVSDYLPALAFLSLNAAGYLVLTDGSVVDPNGRRHIVPSPGHTMLAPRLDTDGRTLVARDGELAFWRVSTGAVDALAERGLGVSVVGPAFADALSHLDAVYVEQDAQGALALVRVTASDDARVVLPARIAERVSASLTTPEAVRFVSGDNSMLLAVDSRPVAFIRVGEEPTLFETGLDLPASPELQRYGDCFSGAPDEAATAGDFLGGLWRVTASGLEVGVRHTLPSGTTPVLPGDGSYTAPACHADGRLLIVLRGPTGDAWFIEGDDAFVQLEARGDYYGTAPHQLVDDGDELEQRRPTIIAGLDRALTTPAGDCELRPEGDAMRMLDLAHALEHDLPAGANAAWLERE